MFCKSALKMNVARKLSLLCVVFCAALCAADVLGKGDQCFVRHLKAAGKLNADFESTSDPYNPLVCYAWTERTMHMVKSSFNGEIKVEMPNDADCLTEEFNVTKSVENVFKIRLIEKSNMNDTEKQNQLVEARNEFTELLEKIAVHCQADKQKFINIFQTVLGIKNETLEAFQTVYCLAKYATDNNLLDMVNVKMNPHNIDTESVNCDGIVDVEKSKAEREIRTIISGMSTASRSLDCIMDAYKSSETVRFQIALKVLHYLDFPKETKESATVSNSLEFQNFLRTSVSTCKNPPSQK